MIRYLVDTNVVLSTARAHGLAILSRNERHFAPIGVTVVDPFKALPPR